MKNKSIINAIMLIYSWMLDKEDCYTLCMEVNDDEIIRIMRMHKEEFIEDDGE